MLVLHHAEASNCTIQDIHQWHLQNGWAGCGYHFLIRKDGAVYRVRPEDAIGTHCPGVNATSIGICAEGEYMTETMPDIQKNAIVELCKYLCSKYGINTIKGQKELYSTDCPGTNYPLQGIKNLVSTGGNVSVTTSTSTASSASNLLKLWSTGDEVKDLQASAKITVDGIVGPETLTACPLIKARAQGNITKWIQTKLGINADGIFGNQTKIAIQNFQARNRLTADGIVGQNTWRKLLGL